MVRLAAGPTAQHPKPLHLLTHWVFTATPDVVITSLQMSKLRLEP